MKKRTMRLCLALTIVLALATVFSACNAKEVTDDAGFVFTYDKKADGYHVVGYDGEEENITLPTAYDGKKILGIEDGVFSGKGIKSITITAPYTELTVGTFSGCDKLTTLTVTADNATYFSAGNCLINKEKKELVFGLSNSVIPTDGSVTSIGDWAFRWVAFESVVIPAAVKKLGEGAFASCESLTSVTIENGVEEIGTFAFHQCKNLKAITIPASVTAIGEYALYVEGITIDVNRAAAPEGWVEWYLDSATVNWLG